MTDWGIYVELDDTRIEGMIAMRDMIDDFYRFDDKSYEIIGQRSGRRYMLGDGVRIRVKQTDLRHRQIDFEMVAKL